ncbi:MAG: M20/M25/M40 family metallo-hydrolase [Leptospiraceae bacterium]|nr:M20/M25/M40 family metallo-hydrolase [Leptospiraceae bacterium]
MTKKISITLISIFLILILYISFSYEYGISIAKEGSYPLPKDSIDWKLISDTAAKDLQGYIKIRSIRGNEKEACLYLQKILKREGISSKIIEYPGDPLRANLIAELPGELNEGGVILANHTDVVEANSKEWERDPFSGDIANGRVFGRGAVDMKGMGIMQLHAFIQIKKKNIKLKRKLMFLAMADEETGSKQGAKFLVERHPEIFKGYEYVLNEGGVGTKDVAIPGSKIFNLQYAEKGILWIRVISTGTSGHGSTPPTNYATLDLMKFLFDLQEMETSVTITDETSKFFYQMGEASKFPNSFFLKRAHNPIVKKILAGIIKGNRHLRAMTSNTRSITSLSTEKAGPNVITDKAEAVVDIRLLPGITPENYLEKIQELAKGRNITIEVISKQPPTSSDLNGELFQILSSVAMKNETGAVITPFLSPGATDSHFLRKLGLKCYGLIPAIMTAEDIDGMHGKNESISIQNLQLGMKVIYEMIYGMN